MITPATPYLGGEVSSYKLMPSHKLCLHLRELVDSRIFFAGAAVLIFGLLILVYDLPQIAYIQAMTIEELQLRDGAELEKFQRIQSEFYAGIGISVIGGVLILFSRFPPSAFNRK